MIRNIIFDLGGVILNIDYKKTAQAFKNLGILDFDNLYSQAQQSQLFDNFEKGLISPNKFRASIKILSHLNLSDKQIDEAWNAMLLDLPSERIQLLLDAKSKYRTFLLSNTNEIHFKAYTKNLYKEHNINSLSNLFESEFYSHKIHLRKPDFESFNFLIKTTGIEKSETLFIDDSFQHIDAAKKAGFLTFFMDKSKNEDLKYLFKNGLLKSDFINAK